MKIYNDPVFEIKMFKAENVITASANDQKAIDLVKQNLTGQGVAAGKISTYNVVGGNWE